MNEDYRKVLRNKYQKRIADYEAQINILKSELNNLRENLASYEEFLRDLDDMVEAKNRSHAELVRNEVSKYELTDLFTTADIVKQLPDINSNLISNVLSKMRTDGLIQIHGIKTNASKRGKDLNVYIRADK